MSAAEARFPGASAEQAIADRARDAGQATGAVSAPEGTGSSEPFQSASATTHARVGMELPPTRGVFASNFSSAQQYLAATAAAQSGRGMTIGDFSSSSASREALAINTRASNPDLRSSDLSMPSSMPPPARQYSRDAYSSDRPAASPSTAFSEQPVSAQLSTGTPVQPGSIGAAPVTPLGMQAVQSSISAALNLRASRPEYEALTANGTRTPLSSTTERFRPSQVPDFEKERLRIRIDELQTLVDRQNGDLQRRNDELLDLQRNHEAFREKFILFREGMRSKTDESDARFRKLEAELKLSQEELARHRGQMDRKLAGDEASTMRAKDLEAKIEALSKEGMELKEQLQVARNNSAEKVLAQKESLLRDLRTRVENQAEVIRSQNAKMAGLEVRAVEAQTLQSQTHSERARADEELLELQRINKDMEMRHASQVAALNQHAGKLGEVTKTLDEERQTVAALRSELEKAQAKQRETEAAAESQDAEAGRLQQRIQMLDQQIQRASATEADLRVKLNAALAAPKADPNQPAMIQDLQARLSQQSQAVENANSNLAARERAVQDLELQVQQLSDEASRQRKTSQHENAVFTSTRQTMQKEIDSLKRKMNDAVASSLGAKAAEDRATQMEQQARGLQARLAQIQEENAGLRQALQAARSAKQDHVQRDSQRMPELEERLGQATATIALLQQQLSRADAGALSGTSGAAPLVLANLQRARDVLLAKLIGNWQKQVSAPPPPSSKLE